MPDIDFNIRAGNTLVGYATRAEVEKSAESDLLRKMALPKILEDAEITDRAFKLFRQLQTRSGATAKEKAQSKSALQQRLTSLENQLNAFLADDYNKWLTEARDHLFHTLRFTETTRLVRDGSMPKVGANVETSVLSKVSSSPKTLNHFSASIGRNHIYYTRKLSWFVQILDFVPGITDGHGRKREPSELKEVVVTNEQQRNAFLCALNSTLFYWLLTVWSDCRNLNKREVLGISLDFDSLDTDLRDKFDKLAGLLMDDFKKNSRILEMNYAEWGMMKIQCIYPKHSKSILDKIDTVLARHYGFTAEELDFIINYDIKYRLGRDGGEED